MFTCIISLICSVIILVFVRHCSVVIIHKSAFANIGSITSAGPFSRGCGRFSPLFSSFQ